MIILIYFMEGLYYAKDIYLSFDVSENIYS